MDPQSPQDLFDELWNFEEMNEYSGAERAGTYMMPQEVFTQAIASSAVMNTMHSDLDSFQSVQPRTSTYGRKMTGTAQNKKKEIDRAYRERVKSRQRLMEAEIAGLITENAHLKNENEALIKVTSKTNESSQSATAEKEKLEKDISSLNHDIKNLQNYFDLYSKRLVNSNHVDHQGELINLKNKISILRENSNRNIWMTEKQKFKDQNEELEHQNKVLKVQVEALCEMKTDKDFEEKQA